VRSRLSRLSYDREHYLDTPEGLLAQHWVRRRRRIYLSIDGIEPRAKGSMSERNKDEVQRQALDWLIRLKRRAFTGPLALRLTLQTTDKAPTHSHNAAKNLLDLFARPRPAIVTKRRALLYGDDSQVHALSVTCHHGESVPGISVIASPLGSLIQDIELATKPSRDYRTNYQERQEEQRFDMVLDEFKDLRRKEAQYRDRLGDATFEAMLWISRRQAQEYLLGRAALTPSYLAGMYDVSGRALGFDIAAAWETIFASTPLRIQLTELPQVRGSSTVWREEIDDKLRAFQTEFGWLVDPLLIPVALEVVIKPPPPSRQNGLHDLDNVLRTYLIPRVVDILKPISHVAFTPDLRAARRDPPEVPARGALDLSVPRPPASTKAGVTRYEAWRLPPAKAGTNGFVSVAIVADVSGYGDVLGQIDDDIEDWRESLELPS
jgi:hypothetical protein